MRIENPFPKRKRFLVTRSDGSTYIVTSRLKYLRKGLDFPDDAKALWPLTDQVVLPPGLQLKNFAEFFCSRRVFEEVLEPTLRDLFDEYCEALKDGRTWKAKWVRIRGYWSFWSAVVAQLPISLVKKAYELWKASQ